MACRANFALGWQFAQPGHMPVKLRREETNAPHFAVSDNIDSGVFLIADGKVYRVILSLAHIFGAIFAAPGGFQRGMQPRRPRIGANDACC